MECCEMNYFKVSLWLTLWGCSKGLRKPGSRKNVGNTCFQTQAQLQYAVETLQVVLGELNSPNSKYNIYESHVRQKYANQYQTSSIAQKSKTGAVENKLRIYSSDLIDSNE